MMKKTDRQLAEEIKAMGAEEKQKVLHRQSKLLTDQIREVIRREETLREAQKIADEIFADLPDEEPTGRITTFYADEILNEPTLYSKKEE